MTRERVAVYVTQLLTPVFCEQREAFVSQLFSQRCLNKCIGLFYLKFFKVLFFVFSFFPNIICAVLHRGYLIFFSLLAASSNDSSLLHILCRIFSELPHVFVCSIYYDAPKRQPWDGPSPYRSTGQSSQLLQLQPSPTRSEPAKPSVFTSRFI